ncbi:hypothetical protein BDQ12DRAFT_689892 [Crucibulum laeve]|uniref:Secreted protein n=1 Tax=Crucibulum laeve TaxID=68775 RepID=A0A5C3LPM0_9AGAR|nr:hypothetical protein BDQ12DRAFT_689892 [Crucibulum laeve]
MVGSTFSYGCAYVILSLLDAVARSSRTIYGPVGRAGTTRGATTCRWVRVDVLCTRCAFVSRISLGEVVVLY